MRIRSNVLEARRRAISAAALTALILGASALLAQVRTPQTSATHDNTSYLQIGRIPAIARSYLEVFGDRLTKPGHERAILRGSYSDNQNAKGSAQVSWE